MTEALSLWAKNIPSDKHQAPGAEFTHPILPPDCRCETFHGARACVVVLRTFRAPFEGQVMSDLCDSDEEAGFVDLDAGVVDVDAGVGMSPEPALQQ